VPLVWQVADVVDGPQEQESLALYNGQRTVLLSVQKSQGENTIAVVDGLQRVAEAEQAAAARRTSTEINRDNSRSIRVSVANVQRTLLEGAALTVLIVFLFLNSWRSTVITGLTLPIALIGTFLFMYAFGFTINTITLMALSLCVGLLIDDAIVVRENIVRHVQMGKSAHDAALQGTDEIGLAVLATTLSIVAVFLPIGFMGGIVGKFFHEFGITIVAAVLISMFVSFTLDPMLSSVWHDPEAHTVRTWATAVSRCTTARSGRVTGAFDRLLTQLLSAVYQRLLAWSLVHQIKTVLIATGSFLLALVLFGARQGVRAQGGLLGDAGQLLHAGGLVAGSHRDARQAGRRRAARTARGAPHRDHHQQRLRPGQDLRLRLRAPGRPQGPPAQRRPDDSCRCASGWRASRASRSPTSASPTWAAARASAVLAAGPDLAELERLGRQVLDRLQRDSRPGRPGQHAQARQAHRARGHRRDAAADLGLNVNAWPTRCAPAGRADGGQLARQRRRELRRAPALAPGPAR
jgi:HAE1 family hydrophobic/amphiphilic exporter-1